MPNLAAGQNNRRSLGFGRGANQFLRGGWSHARFLRLMPDSTDQPNLPPPAPKSLRLLTILLSLCVILYLADGLVSLADDSLILVLNIHLLGLLRGLVTLCSLLVALSNT